MFYNSYVDENGKEVCDNLGNSLLVYDGNEIYDAVSGNTVDNIENDIENDIDVSENTKFFYDNSKSSFYYHIYFTPSYIWNKLQQFFECLYRSISSVIKEPISVISVKDSNKN